jgi:hypothetical protein
MTRSARCRTAAMPRPFADAAERGGCQRRGRGQASRVRPTPPTSPASRTGAAHRVRGRTRPQRGRPGRPRVRRPRPPAGGPAPHRPWPPRPGSPARTARPAACPAAPAAAPPSRPSEEWARRRSGGVRRAGRTTPLATASSRRYGWPPPDHTARRPCSGRRFRPARNRSRRFVPGSGRCRGCHRARRRSLPWRRRTGRGPARTRLGLPLRPLRSHSTDATAARRVLDRRRTSRAP